VIIAHSLGGSATLYSLSQLQPGAHVRKVVTINSPSSIYEVVKQYAEEVALPRRVHQKMEQAIGGLGDMSIHELNLGRLSRGMQVDEILVVHDRDDDTVPFFHGEELFSNQQNGRMLITEGYGHNRPLRDAKVIEKILTFVQAPVRVKEIVEG